MRYTSVKLVGYKRFLLNNIREFTFTPTERFQLILGTNGCGKSSLIEEISPFPAAPSDYSKDGSKTVVIMHHGIEYVLTSVFAPKAHHEFMKDGVPMNQGGTASVQKELIKQEFGYTQDFHAFIIGKERFSEMSIGRRRELLTSLSVVSYDYALKVYDKLREMLRDATGTMRRYKERLVNETSKLISKEEEEQLLIDVQNLHDELTLLQTRRAPVERPSEALSRDADRMCSEVLTLSTRVLQRYASVDIEGRYASKESLDEKLETSKLNVAALESKLVTLVEIHDRLQSDLEILKKTGEQGIEVLIQKRDAIVEEQKAILVKRKLGFEDWDTQRLQTLEAIYDDLSAILQVLPINEGRRFSMQRLETLRQEVKDIKEIVHTLQRQLDAHIATKNHLELHKNDSNVQCPACNHRWVLNYSPEKLAKVNNAIEKFSLEIDAGNLAIAGKETDIKETEEYLELYNNFGRCAKSAPNLKVFWNYLVENEFVTNAPRKALAVLEVFRKDCSFERDAHEKSQAIAEINALISQAEHLGAASLTDTMAQLALSETEISNLTQALIKERAEYNSMMSDKRAYNELMEMARKLDDLMFNADKLNNDAIEALRREIIIRSIQTLQVSLATKSEALSNHEMQKQRVTDLEVDIEKLKLEEECLKLMVKELSPTEGLIADGMMGFIRNFTGQINGLIRKVWSYPLQVYPCGASNEKGAELDYKFPLMIQSKDNVVPDISKGSSGMVEIVDLGARIVSLRYMGLSASPLYLDEFGRTLDKAHRTSAMEMIRSLMETLPFTQMFMVNHYSDLYGGFANVQTCVLDSRNIALPQSYNEHVVIE